MLKAMKGKRVIRIPTDKKDSYIALGYSITDMEGNVIYDSKSSKKESAVKASDTKTSTKEK